MSTVRDDVRCRLSVADEAILSIEEGEEEREGRAEPLVTEEEGERL